MLVSTVAMKCEGIILCSSGFFVTLIYTTTLVNTTTMVVVSGPATRYRWSYRHNSVTRSDITSFLKDACVCKQNIQITLASACNGRQYISFDPVQIFCSGTRGDET